MGVIYLIPPNNLYLDEASEDDKEQSVSAPSSPTMKRTLHRRQRSQSLDGITIDDNSLPIPSKIERGLTTHTPHFTGKDEHDDGVMLALPKGTGSDESESEVELGLYEAAKEKERISSTLSHKDVSSVPLLCVLADPKEIDGEDESRGGGGGKLNQLKGRLLMKVKSSKSNFLPRSRSRSPQQTNDTPAIDRTSPKKSHFPVILSDGDKGHVPGSSEGGSQWVGAVRHRLKVGPPAIWSKKQKSSPTILSGTEPVPGEEGVVKLEEARKRSRSRLVFI